MNQPTFVTALVAGMALASAGIACADEGLAPVEATAMVKKGVAFIRANGNGKGYAEINSKTGRFKDRDLHLQVYGLDGTVRAHGENKEAIGKNLIELTDVDGRAFIKGRVDLAVSKGTFWQDYRFTNPSSKKIELVSMYCEKLEDSAVCGGIYK